MRWRSRLAVLLGKGVVTSASPSGSGGLLLALGFNSASVVAGMAQSSSSSWFGHGVIAFMLSLA